MIKDPFFTIITASFNSEKAIKQTIESVLNQNYTNFEYIIIDGGSNDYTIEIIKSFESGFKEKGISYKWQSEKDEGIYDAFNKGINLASGNWVSFLGSDDVYLLNSLEKYYKTILKSRNEVDICFSNIKIVGENKKDKVFDGKWKWNRFRRKMSFAHVGAFHNRSFFKKYGTYNIAYKIAGDYELLLRANEKLRTLKLDELTVVMSDLGISNRKIMEVYKETTRAKIETGKVSFILSKSDYFLWTLKHKIKKILHALAR